MRRHFFLSASGADHPGFVAAISKRLFDLDCNLEDSSMMRLGSEFAMFVIFTSAGEVSDADFVALQRKSDMRISVRGLSGAQARFRASKHEPFIVRVHGKDHPGIVFHVTDCLARHRFNITDLSTHRTTAGRTPGYILLIEGELLRRGGVGRLRSDLRALSKRLNTRISLEPVSALPI